MIKAVLFDYGGTLVIGGEAGLYARVIGDALGLSGPANISDLLEELKRNKITSVQFINAVNARYTSASNQLDDKIWFHTSFDDVFLKNDSMYELVAWCRRKGLVAGVFSNVYLPTADIVRQKGLYDGFDHTILSCDAGYAKPDKEFYEYAQKKLNVNPSEILLIDDQEKGLEAARIQGWKTIQFKPDKDIMDELKKFASDI